MSDVTPPEMPEDDVTIPKKIKKMLKRMEQYCYQLEMLDVPCAFVYRPMEKESIISSYGNRKMVNVIQAHSHEFVKGSV